MGAMSTMAIGFEGERKRRRQRVGERLQDRGFLGAPAGTAATVAAGLTASELKKRRQGAGRLATDVVRPTGRPLGGGFLGY